MDATKDEDQSVGIMSRPDEMDDGSYNVYSVQRRGLRRYWFCNPKLIIALTGGLALLCLAIGLGVSLSKRKQNGAVESNGAGSSGDDQDFLRGSFDGVISLPPARSNLSDLCSKDNLSNQEGFEGCEQACELAECCLPSSDNGKAQNCFSENPQDCAEYEPCLVIFDGTFGAPYGSTATIVESEIETKFATKAMELACNSVDLHKCEELCEVGKCCFQEDVECEFSEQNHCEQFISCSTLDVLDKTFHMDNWEKDFGEQISGEVAEKEAYNKLSGICRQDDLGECQSECEAGICCFESYTKCSPESNSCDVFLPCTALSRSDARFSIENFHPYNEGSMTEIEKYVPEGLSEVCSLSNLDKCIELCDDGRCCFEEGDDCGFDKFKVCNSFSPCTALESVDETFMASNMETGGKPGGGSSNIVVQAAPIKEACDPESIEMYGVEACRDLCGSFNCCYLDGEENCLETNDQCDDVGAPCSILFDGSIEGLTVGESNGKGPTLPFEEICSAKSIKVYGKQACRDACDKYACCFEKGDKNCSAVHDCDGYVAPCGILYSDGGKIPGGPVVQVAPVKEACQPKSIEMYGREACEDLCDVFACCFEGDEGCGGSVDCDGMGAPCEILYGGKPIVIEKPPLIPNEGPEVSVPEKPFSGNGNMPAAPVKEACQEESIEMYGMETCQDMCAGFKCCFESGDDNCAATNNCQMGAPCSILYGEMPTTEYVSSVGELQGAPMEEACSPKSIVLYGRQTCKDMCKPFACCLDEGDQCDEDVDCDGTGAPCKILNGKDEEIVVELPPVMPSGGESGSLGGVQAAPIKEACSPESIELYTDEMCREFCSGYKCCFEEGEDNCEDENDCEIAAPCSAIYGSGFTDN